MEVVVALSVGVAAPTATKTGILLPPRSHYRSLSSSRGACASLIATSCGRRNFSQRIASHRRGNRTCRISCSQVRLEDIDDDACELVNGAELILGDGIDTFRAYLFTAVKNNNGTGILLLSDVHGFEASSTRDFAYRVACNGYNVLVPDLFRGSPWDKNRPRSEFDDWVAKHPFKRVSKDMSTAAKWMSDEFEAAGIHKKLAMVGFCFGGGCLIQALAQDQGAYISTAVCFYGTHMNPSVAANITIPILFISGDNDPLCSISEMQDLAKSIGRGSNVVVFKDRGHAFVHRPGSPEEDSDAEQAFVVMRNWLHDGLGASKTE